MHEHEPQPFDRQAELRDRILNQDAELMHAANALANKIRSIPPDPKCPDVEPRAYLVGGFVRDAILGKRPKDADLEVYGVSQERLEELLNQLFEQRVNAVGRAFAVYKINLGEGLDLDVAMPRRESATGVGHKDFEIIGDPSMPPEEAARRRDFTINSMLADPLTGEIVDPYHGLEDLDHQVLRAVDPETFIEDPLRVYRALQFCSRMQLAPDETTKHLLKKMVEHGSLDHLPKERVTEEIKKLLRSPKPSIGFELAKKLGIIEKYYPELSALEKTEQESDWHPEGNVWIHTMMVTDEAARIATDPHFEVKDHDRELVTLGALCHDLGKPKTTSLKDGRIRSHGHEAAGKEPAKSLLEKWNFGKETERAVIAMTVDHLTPFQYIRDLTNGKMDERSFCNGVRRLIKRIDPCPWQNLIAVCAADMLGRGGDRMKYLEEITHLRETFAQAIDTHHLGEAPKKKLLRGEDVMAFGIKEGTRIGELINAIEALRDNGEITTKEEGLEKLKEMIEK